MNWVDDLGKSISQSALDEDLRAVLGDFLAANRSVLDTLGPDLGDAFFRTLSTQGTSAAWQVLAQGLTQEQLLAFLRSTREELAAAAQQRTAQAEAAGDLIHALADVALRLLVRSLVAAL